VPCSNSLAALSMAEARTCLSSSRGMPYLSYLGELPCTFASPPSSVLWSFSPQTLGGLIIPDVLSYLAAPTLSGVLHSYYL
jgi:hypothetical protein